MFTTKDYGYLCLDMGNTNYVKDPGYLHFLNHLEFSLTDKIPTAAVALVNTTIQLWINPEFFDKIGTKNQRGVLQHEINHLILSHLFVKDLDKLLLNIAMDLEINQSPFYENNDFLQLPEEGCFYNKAPFDKLKLKPKETYIYYYNELLNNKDKLPQSLFEDYQGDIIIVDNNGNPVDISTLSDEDVEELKQSLKNRVNEIVKGCPPGTVRNTYESNLFFKITPPKVNWGGMLRQFVTSVIHFNQTFTQRRESKRDNYSIFGRRCEEKAKVLIGVDCSGSVNDDLLIKGFNEIYHLHKKGKVAFDIVQCDTELCSFEKYVGTWKGVVRKGCGGTDLTPIVDFYIKNKYDGLIVFTDGEFYTTDSYGHPRLNKSIWIHYPDYKINESLPGIKLNMNS